MVPFAADVDYSFYTWLENAPYPQDRKADLLKTYEESQGYITTDNLISFDKHGVEVVNKYCRVNSFVKDETYPSYKSARSINSRHDVFKVRVAPIFKLIEKELFSLPWFIKHTPVDMRAQEIKDELYQDGATIIGTDYTAYESLFTKEFMQNVEFELYEYMTQNLADQDWLKIVTTTLGGMNWCTYRNKFTLKVPATRMSGEMCTSLGNSYSNLMAMLFIAEEKKLQSLKGRVEGDDGIFTFYGPVPTTQDFADIGMIIKIDQYSSLTEGSFCGIIANETEMINITNPIETLLDFGWTNREYVNAKPSKLKELLRAKAMSLGYSYPGCPILASLARYGLRMTEGHHVSLRAMDTYHKEKFTDMFNKYHGVIPHKDTGIQTRILVENRFGVSIADQLAIESYLDSKTDLTPLNHPAILSNCHKDAVDYFERFVFEFSLNDRVMECPIYENYSLVKSAYTKNTGFERYERNEENKKEEESGYEVAPSKTYWKADAGSAKTGYRPAIEETP